MYRYGNGQKYKPERVSSKRKKIDEFIVDETLIKLVQNLNMARVAVNQKTKEILAINITDENVQYGKVRRTFVKRVLEAVTGKVWG